MPGSGEDESFRRRAPASRVLGLVCLKSQLVKRDPGSDSEPISPSSRSPFRGSLGPADKDSRRCCSASLACCSVSMCALLSRQPWIQGVAEPEELFVMRSCVSRNDMSRWCDGAGGDGPAALAAGGTSERSGSGSIGTRGPADSEAADVSLAAEVPLCESLPPPLFGEVSSTGKGLLALIPESAEGCGRRMPRLAGELSGASDGSPEAAKLLFSMPPIGSASEVLFSTLGSLCFR